MVATATKKNGDQAVRDESPLDAAIEQTEQQMSRDLQLISLENDMMRSEARLVPRDFDRIRGELQMLIDTFPDFADEAIYAKPCGKDDNGKEKIAYGLSIRAAEALAEAYGYNRIVAEAEPNGEFHAKITATFTDFQRMRTWHDSGVLSRKYKKAAKYGGGEGVTPEDRFWGVSVPAEKSRRIREVVNRCVNPALKAWFYASCEAKMAEALGPEVIDKMLAGFDRDYGVTEQQIATYIGRARSMGWTKQDYVNMRGVYNALKENETTVEQAFGEQFTPVGASRAKPSNLNQKLSPGELPADKPAPTETDAEVHARAAAAEQDAGTEEFMQGKKK